MTNLFEMEPQNENTVQESKNITLTKVTLQNYRNVEYKEYNLNGDSVLLEGLNGLGKTNVLEAIFWALSGNLFDGTAKTESQEVIPYNAEKDATTSVKLEFSKDAFVFERRVKQKWSRNKETYKGLATDLLVNNAVSKNQSVALNSLINYLGLKNIETAFNDTPELNKINLFELVYNADWLRTLDYKIVRAIITDMVGEVDFKEIINENQEKYGVLVEPLKKHGLDLAALKSNTRSKIFDKNNGLEIKVKNLKSTIESYENDSNLVASQEDIDNATTEIEKINQEIQELETQKRSGASVDKDFDAKITKLQNKIYERQNNIRVAHEKTLEMLNKNSKVDELKEKQNSLNELDDQRLTLNRTISRKENDLDLLEQRLSNKQGDLKEAEELLFELKAQYQELDNPNASGTTYTCPHCDNLFDVSHTKEHKEKERQRINVKGKETREKVNGLKEGVQTLEDDIEVLTKAILKLQEERNQIDKNRNNLAKDISELQKEVDANQETLPPLDIENEEKVIEYRTEITKLRQEKEQANKDVLGYINGINEKIKALKTKREPFDQVLASETTAKSYRDNAKAKRKELQNVQKELQLQEDIVSLIKMLEKEMYERLDSKVSNLFGDNVKFKLYKLNVSNGEYDTRMCEIYVRDIKDRFVNIKTINTGMFPVRATEIISKIKSHYNIPKSFIFIDEMSGLDNEHLKMVKEFGEQIFATKVGQYTTIKETRF